MSIDVTDLFIKILLAEPGVEELRICKNLPIPTVDKNPFIAYENVVITDIKYKCISKGIINQTNGESKREILPYIKEVKIKKKKPGN